MFLMFISFVSYFTDTKVIYALPDSLASLPCPEETGDVTWSYLENSKTITLVAIKNGEEQVTNKDRYGSLADNTLLIKKVKFSDSRMYFCNKRKVYLEVTTDPVTSGPDEVDSEGSGLKEEDPDKEDSDSKKQESSDLWKVLVGVVIGAFSVLLALLTLRFCSKRREETSKNQTTTEVIYEEIKAVEDQLGRGADVESPLTPNTPTVTNNNMYSTVNMCKDPSRGECVYYLVQSPAPTEGGAEK